MKRVEISAELGEEDIIRYELRSLAEEDYSVDPIGLYRLHERLMRVDDRLQQLFRLRAEL